MSDKRRTSWTPVVVGVVIALLGILTGLYVADNARQQLATTDRQPAEQAEGGAQQPVPTAAQQEQALPELPPLEPIEAIAAEPADEEDAPQASEPADELPVVAEPVKADDTAPADDDADDGEEDDFEEVSPTEGDTPATVPQQPQPADTTHKE